MDWPGTACQANVNGLIRFSVATDQSLSALLVVLISQPVALHALALAESRNATLQVVKALSFIYTTLQIRLYNKLLNGILFQYPFADQSSCNKFQHCFDKIAYRKTCPGGLVWDTFRNKCGWPGEVSKRQQVVLNILLSEGQNFNITYFSFR